jgi:hypothetical protein
MAFVVDGESMHRIAGERQPRDDDLRTFLRRDAIGRQRIADDLVVLFGVEAVLVDANAGAAGRALRDAVAEPLDLVGMAVTLRVLERDQKTAGRHLVVVIVGAAPGVHIQNTVGAEGHLPCVAEIVGEHRRTKARRQRDAAIAAGAAIALPLRGRGVLGRLRETCGRAAHQRERNDKQRCSGGSRNACALADVSDRAVDHDNAPNVFFQPELKRRWRTPSRFQRRNLKKGTALSQS